MFATKLRANLKTVSSCVQRGYCACRTSSPRRNAPSMLATMQASTWPSQTVRWCSDRGGSRITTVQDAVAAIDSMSAGMIKTHTFEPGDLISRCALIHCHMGEMQNVKKLRVILEACARVTDENSDVTELVVAVLNHLASLPADLWQEGKNQQQLRMVLHWAARCRCTTPEFMDLLQRQLDAERIDQCKLVGQCARALFVLNTPDPCLAESLMTRYLAIHATGNPMFRDTEVLSLLLYCTLCGVECSALLKLISVDQLIQNCDVHHLQQLLMHNTLPVTADQRQQIMDKLSVQFQEDVKSQHAGQMYDMLSYFIGPKYTTGISLVDGTKVQALCIFNQDHEPVETAAYPADVYDGVAVDMTAATRRGFSVVACLSASEMNLLRYPGDIASGQVALLASALVCRGCYFMPMALEDGARPSQRSSDFLLDLMINYPHHINVLKDLLPAE
ncbi:uncharacterized protein LOC135823422 [Sycon ciliatum]|uniref:uncharacterized protein LOC135823422 n=1 Tax=Sycon ciliatum TaxID=27933 RepID=UPI0031F67B43